MTVDLEAQLRDYAGYVGSLSSPVEFEEILHERIGPEPVRPIRVREPRRHPPRWLYGVAAAVLALLLVGGVAWLSRWGTQEAPVVTQPPAPTTTVIPEAISSSLGDLTWTRAGAARPRKGQNILAFAGGFVAVQSYPNQWWTSADGKSWTSSPLPVDAAEAVLIGEDGTGALLIEKDGAGTYWLTGPSSGAGAQPRLWRSDDAVSWSEVDTSAFRGPSMSGVEWVVVPQSYVGVGGGGGRFIVSNGDTTLAGWRIAGLVDWRDLLGLESPADPCCGPQSLFLESEEGLPPLSLIASAWDPQSQVLELADLSNGAVVARVVFSVQSEDPLTIEVTDVETGHLVHTFVGIVERLSTDEMLAGLANGFNIGVLGVSDNGREFEQVPTPWTANEGQADNPWHLQGYSGLVPTSGVERYTRIVASGGRFFAYSLEAANPTPIAGEGFSPGSGGTVETWVSSDGKSWTSAGTPAFAQGRDVAGLTVVLERDGVFLIGVYPGGRSPFGEALTLWRSEDGIDWTQLTDGAPMINDYSQAHVADSGWIFTTRLDNPEDPERYAGVFAMSVSTDALTWQQIDIVPGEGPPIHIQGFAAKVAGDTIFVSEFVGTFAR